MSEGTSTRTGQGTGAGTAVEMADVSWTALAVAAGRAMEARRGDAFFQDPLAEAFVRAAAPSSPFPTDLFFPEGDGDGDAAGAGAGGEGSPTDQTAATLTSMMGDYLAVRTRYFDTYVREAAEAGARQFAVVAAGLDTRAYRLPLPAGARLFELDMPGVLDFKDRVVREEGAEPVCERIRVDADLREEWADALVAAGFDPQQPTAWLAEGLLPYLSSADCDRMLKLMTGLSAPGSRLATEHIAMSMVHDPQVQELIDRTGFAMDQLLHGGPAQEPVAWLAGQGWAAEADDPGELALAYGRSLPPFLHAGSGERTDHGQALVRARLTADGNGAA